MRPNISSCLPSAYWRSSSVSLAHFCFNLPLVMFQSPLISRVVIMVFDLLLFVLIRRQRDGKSVVAARGLALPVNPPRISHGYVQQPVRSLNGSRASALG